MITQTMVKKNGELVIVDAISLDFKDGELRTILEVLIERHPKYKLLRASQVIVRCTEKFPSLKTFSQLEKFFHV